VAWLGMVWQARQGTVGHGMARNGTAWQARLGLARRGSAGLGQVRQVWFFVSVLIDGVDRDEDTRS
jgi:hypothetical protein